MAKPKCKHTTTMHSSKEDADFVAMEMRKNPETPKAASRKCRHCEGYFIHQNGLQRQKVYVPKEKKKKPNGRAETGLSKRQMKNNDDFMKVRPGETHEQWSHRTRFRRIITEEEVKKNIKTKRLITLIERPKKQAREAIERYYDKVGRMVPSNEERRDMPLKYYLAIMTYFSSRFRMVKSDIEFCFYLYDLPFFTKEEFENKAMLVQSNFKGMWRRFKSMGYVVSLGHKEQQFYRLSVQLQQRIAAIYRMFEDKSIENVAEKTFKRSLKQDEAAMLDSWLREMRQSVKDIEEGKKLPETLLLGEEEDE